MSSYFEIGSSVEVMHPGTGSWVDGIIIDIKPSEKSQELQHSEYVYNVLTDSGNKTEEMVAELTLLEIREIPYNNHGWDELKSGMMVEINYNLKNPGEYGSWYDFIVGRVTKSATVYTVRGVLLVGLNGEKDKVTIDIDSNHTSHVLKIQPPVLLVDKNKGKYDVGVRPEYCKYCKNLPTRKCKKCFCVVCGSKQNPETQVMCDECDSAYHMNCLEPKMSHLPSGEWYCSSCSNKTHDNDTVCIHPIDLVGHVPGVEIGSVFTTKNSLCRAGVHRNKHRLIHVLNGKVLSLVITKDKKNVIDHGDQIILSYPSFYKEMANCCAANSNFTSGTTAIDWKDGSPVRIVRKLQTKDIFGNMVTSYRYDGVYKITEYKFELTSRGRHAEWKYYLKKCDSEEIIDTCENISSNEERNAEVTEILHINRNKIVNASESISYEINGDVETNEILISSDDDDIEATEIFHVYENRIVNSSQSNSDDVQINEILISSDNDDIEATETVHDYENRIVNAKEMCTEDVNDDIEASQILYLNLNDGSWVLREANEKKNVTATEESNSTADEVSSLNESNDVENDVVILGECNNPRPSNSQEVTHGADITDANKEKVVGDYLMVMDSDGGGQTFLLQKVDEEHQVNSPPKKLKKKENEIKSDQDQSSLVEEVDEQHQVNSPPKKLKKKEDERKRDQDQSSLVEDKNCYIKDTNENIVVSNKRRKLYEVVQCEATKVLQPMFSLLCKGREISNVFICMKDDDDNNMQDDDDNNNDTKPFKLSDKIKSHIEKDVINKSLWNEAEKQLVNGKDAFLDKVRELFKCPVCSDLIKSPWTLSCRHNFCSECFKGMLRKNIYNCALCREHVVLNSHYTDNTDLSIVLDMLFDK